MSQAEQVSRRSEAAAQVAELNAEVARMLRGMLESMAAKGVLSGPDTAALCRLADAHDPTLMAAFEAYEVDKVRHAGRTAR